ncbi:hypothetical protein [Geobacter argillaceus]|uniref:Uncharacterized protein n=1 Tax=Geobacter argillaceus TaxID=345631 RepID=A0A562VKR6_9BACT|nr:hypothetical protein [Geobacter argillaceus]TWJ18412.1 hypothetical protein JN12_02634 [Geobacter argillaceus]
MKKHLFTIGAALIALQGLFGCGGGGGTDSLTPVNPSSTATITFAVLSTSHAAPIRGIEVKMTLPQGLSVKTATNSNQIDSTVLKGLKNAGSLPVSGTYAASTNQIDIIVVDVSGNVSGIGFGKFAQLVCNLQSGTSVSQLSLSAPTLFDVQGPSQFGSLPNMLPLITLQ